jgi:hypothetical protein
MKKLLFISIGMIAIFLLLVSWHLSACTPGGLTCPPNKSVLEQVLKKNNPDIKITSLSFSTRPFGSPTNETQHFRVEFKGEAKLISDLFYSIDDYSKFCELPSDFVYPEQMFSVYKKVASKGEKIRFSGDTALYGEAGQWADGANLMNYEKLDGTHLYGSSAASLAGPEKKPLIIIGEPSDAAYCDSLKNSVRQSSEI